MSDEVRSVRLRPEIRKGGIAVSPTYTHRVGKKFIKFNEVGRWIDVPKWLADELKKVRVQPEKPESPLRFDVYEPAEAERVQAEEQRLKAEAKAKKEPTLDDALDLTHLEEPGRGDLSLDEVRSSKSRRQQSLEEFSSRSQPKTAEEEPVSKPKKAAKRKPRKKR